MAFPAYPSIQSFVNKLLIFPKKNAQKPHCIFNKVIHSVTMGPGLPQTRALVTKCSEDSFNATINKRAS